MAHSQHGEVWRVFRRSPASRLPNERPWALPPAVRWPALTAGHLAPVRLRASPLGVPAELPRLGGNLAKRAFGADVVEHYAHFYENEVRSFDKVVTDWERQRYFEQI